MSEWSDTLLPKSTGWYGREPEKLASPEVRSAIDRDRRPQLSYLSLDVHALVLRFALDNNLRDEGDALAVIAYRYFETQRHLAEAITPDAVEHL
jgi:hypothetical protein